MKMNTLHEYWIKYGILFSKKEQKDYWKLPKKQRHIIRLIVAYAPNSSEL